MSMFTNTFLAVYTNKLSLSNKKINKNWGGGGSDLVKNVRIVVKKSQPESAVFF